MDGSFMEDLGKGLIMLAVLIGVACFVLGAGVVMAIVKFT